MRTESGSLKGKDGRKRRSVAINLGAEQERSTRGIKSFWRSSALCSAANIYRLFTACGRAKKCVSRQYRRKRLGACGAERQGGSVAIFRLEPVVDFMGHARGEGRDQGERADAHSLSLNSEVATRLV